MTYEGDEEWHAVDQPSAPPRGPRRWPLILAALCVLALACAVGAYAWMNLDGLVQLSGHEAPRRPETSPGDKAMLTDLLAAQQKMSEDLEALHRTLADQQAQLKSMSEQLGALGSRVDTLQSAAVPQSGPTEPIGRTQVVPAKKSSQAPKRAGPISVGGAPLNAAPPR